MTAVNGINGAGSGNHSVITQGKTARPLDIAIIDAGIGGLTAAVGLRRSGHNVAVCLK
jgi:NADPH-dependent glutamate synthase beta subunit-like oxidoreductase